MDSYRMESGAIPPRSRVQGRSAKRSLGPRKGGRGGASGGGGGGKRFRFFNKKWILLVLMTTLLLVVGGCSAIFMTAKAEDMDQIKKRMEESSSLMDNKGHEAVKLGGTNREFVKISDIKSPELAKAFAKVEDERFYEHNGVDFQGLARAMVKNVIAMGKAEGASTITMQVARNAVLGDREKTYTRKLKEIAVAMDLERNYSKQKILETYINYIDLGNNVRGVKMAAKIYFDKDITKEKLKPEEIALLAGLPKAPYGYDPFSKPEKAKQRRNVVLMKMAEDSTLPPLISEEEKERAQKKPLGVNPDYVKKHIKKGDYSAYKEIVMKEINERYPQLGRDEKELVSSGYKIYTGLDQKAQKAAEAAIKNDKFYQNSAGQVEKGLDAGLTLMNPKNGEIVAIGGGRKYLTGYMNRAKQPMQPGSVIKPITVFGPAVKDKGYNEYSIVQDEPIQIGQWEPQNMTRKVYGEIEMKEMVAKSLNLSTIRLLKDVVKLDRAYDYAQKAGLELTPKDRKSYAALGLGGLTKGVNTIQMAQAYSTFANSQGMLTEGHTIKKIVDPYGNVVPPEKQPKKRQVYDKKTAYYMNRMLKNAVEKGTGVNAQLDDGRPLAGKTGTTQKSKEAWFVGYTPQLVGAVNVFNEKGSEVELTGGGYPAKIFKEVMEVAMEGKPVVDFKNPGVKEPSPPFQLRAVDGLSGGFDGKKVNLQWNDYDESNRVKYRVERSEDGSNWSPIGETPDGAFSDNQIEIPKKKGGFEEFFGGSAEPKQYYYRIVAVDTQPEDGSPAEADPSGSLEVRIDPQGDDKPKKEKPEDQQPEDQQPEDQQPQDQQPQDQQPEDQQPEDQNPLPDGGEEGTQEPPGNERGNGQQGGEDDGGGLFGGDGG
ncbi:transglycosylase domain-containing protein [Salinithrix halophila]|uniref:Transglycosylase domain-containing protein n=1 Tax=Salinithrix halophila TaxID=1485204 RepID=A0ABV8JCP1_9BACL